MNFTYKISAKLTSVALKKAETKMLKTIEKESKWSYEYFNKYWPMSYGRFTIDFKKKYGVKHINNGSFLENLLQCQYLAYKVYLTFNLKTYENYLTCIKDTANDLKNMKGPRNEIL